jgi:hypothetical protein
MQVTRFDYQYGDEIRTIDMIVVGHTDLVKRLTADPAPYGYEVKYDMSRDDGSVSWTIDDEPTTIIHPIVSYEPLGIVRRVITA